MTESTMLKRRPVAIAGTGLVSGVGLNTLSSCAAIRAAIDNFQETRFMDTGGEWIQGCEVGLEQPWRGVAKLARMLAMALSECAEQGSVDLSTVPIIIGLAEKDRPGRLQDLGARIISETQELLGITFHSDSSLVEYGRVSGLVALQRARSALYKGDHDRAVIAGVDSLLTAPALRAFEEQERVLTSKNSNGFIPGEGAAALVVELPHEKPGSQLLCLGLGFGVEEATIDSELPLRADGLVGAIKSSLADAELVMEDMDFRIVDVSGEHYWFKESSLALLRTLHTPKPEFDIWHPADCMGEVGAAIGLVIPAIAKTAYEKGYSKGNNLLVHCSNSGGKRASAAFSYRKVEAV